MHIETITFQATAPGASGAAAAAATGDSLTIKNSKSAANIIALWGRQQTAGWQQIAFPSGHDTTRGFRHNVAANEPENHLSIGIGMPVQPQELLTVTIAGSATAGDVETGCALVYYDDLPGVNSRLIRWHELVKRAAAYTTVSATLTGAAAGYTGSELINAESDLLRANRDYAVMGITTNSECAAVSLIGPDTGYQRVSVPGDKVDAEHCQEWFGTLARSFDMPCIPVINSGNRNATYLSFVQDENNISPLVTLYLALLDKS
jgi:hypothetical protein